MLKGLDPLLTPALLYHLASMGHGDEVAVVDRNFPASATARRLVRLPGTGLVAAAGAVLAVLPLDQLVPAPVAVMTSSTGVSCCEKESSIPEGGPVRNHGIRTGAAGAAGVRECGRCGSLEPRRCWRIG